MMEQWFKEYLMKVPPITNSDGLQGYAKLGDFVKWFS